MHVTTTSERAYLPAGSLILLSAAICSRALIIGFEGSVFWGLFAAMWDDLPLLVLVFALGAIRARMMRRNLAFAILGIEFVLVLVVVVDAATLSLINRHAWPAEILWVLPSVPEFACDIPARHYLALMAVPFVFLLRLPISRSSLEKIPFLTTCAMLIAIRTSLGTHGHTISATHYLETLASNGTQAPPVSSPSKEQISEARRLLAPWVLPKVPTDRRSIILVVNESFSACDSMLLSGINDDYPRFDELTKKGRLYSNGFANAYNTLDGISAILTGVAPIAALDGSRPHALLKNLPSRISAFVDAGYQTEYLSAAGLRYGSMIRMLLDLGFMRVRSGNYVDRFRKAPRFTWNSAPDGVLYDEAIERVEHLKTIGDPFLLVIETISGHAPYRHPLGGPDTERDVRRYVDQTMATFAEKLHQNGLLDNTTLVITGDHRKQMGLSQPERDRFGAGALARIPVFVMGHGVTPGVSSQVVQQVDLLDDIEKLSLGHYRTRFPILIYDRRSRADYGFPVDDRTLTDGVILDPATSGRSGTTYTILGGTVRRTAPDFPGYTSAEILMNRYQLALLESSP